MLEEALQLAHLENAILNMAIIQSVKNETYSPINVQMCSG